MPADRERLAALTWTVAPETTLADGLAAFLTDCEARRLSPRTLEFYRREVGRFVGWLQDRDTTTLGGVTAGEIRAFLIELQGRGLKDTSQRCAAVALRAWLFWLEREELIPRSPMRKVRMPKVDKRILPAFTADDIRRLLSACLIARDRLIVLCLLDTGCRVSEFLALNMGDIDIASGRVLVRSGKGGRDRVTWLGDRTRRPLALYLELERADAGENAPIWTSLTSGERMTDNGLRQTLQRIGERAGVKHCHPHTFRRTCALMMHRSGARLTEIAALLGHSDLQMLKRYLDLQEQDAEDAHRRHGPVDGLGL